MKLRILCVGKLKQSGLEALAADYIKRSRRHFPIELLHVRDAAALRAKRGSPHWVLDERGEQLDSETLATGLTRLRDNGVRQLDLLIGDAHGFNDEDRAAAQRVIGLSRLTLPHRLAQVLLVEQLYRAGTIADGHPYHHT